MNSATAVCPTHPHRVPVSPLRSILVALAAVLIVAGAVFAASPAASAAPKESEVSNQDVALKIVDVLDRADEAGKKGDFDSAYKLIQTAYFTYYDPILEGPSRSLSGSRKPKMEGLFSTAKLDAKEKNASGMSAALEQLKIGVCRDALVLDGQVSDEAPEAQKVAAAKKLMESRNTAAVSQDTRRAFSFLTAFTLLMREGLEALLVVSAIILYLVRSGNSHLNRFVYAGVAAGVVLSFLLALAFTYLVDSAGAAQEVLEGVTMFIAVFVLFYISNWMLGKADGRAWQAFVQGKVDRSVSQGSAWLLAFAAFLAVAREGAELVLFYVAAFSGGRSDPFWIGVGMLSAAAVLAIIFVIFRYGAVRLPIGLVFKGTSILLFALAITFVGNGVGELAEAGFILGQTNIPSLEWITFPDLGLYPRAETLLPQLILLIAAIWLFLAHRRELARQRREAAEVSQD